MSVFAAEMIRFQKALWEDLVVAVGQSSEGRHEAGAFLLGTRTAETRDVSGFVLYDCLFATFTPRSIRLPSQAYDELWKICREVDKRVVADVHCHPSRAFMSEIDANNPMIPEVGHIAIVLPDFGQRLPRLDEVGVFEYRGSFKWFDRSGVGSHCFLRIV